MDDNIINGLESKIGELISRYEALKVDNAQKEKELSECKQIIDNQTDKITKLKKQIDNLQLSEAFISSSGDKKEARQLIQRLIKEIDQSIIMLND